MDNKKIKKKTGPKPKPPLQRFLSKVKKTDNCWLWIGSLRKDGYGRFGINKKTIAAYRVSYELFIGQIPKGMHVCHKCDNPPCVNPEHLFLGTHKDNYQDMMKKGRKPSKLNKEQILEIRKMHKEKTACYSQMANMFNVVDNTIWHIVSRKTWTHI